LAVRGKSGGPNELAVGRGRHFPGPRSPARKKWGQHFLVGEAAALRIVEAAGIGPADTVVEVGPGEGALTRPLAGRAARLLALEIDPRRAAALRAEFSGDPRVRVVHGDALARPFREWLSSEGFEGPAVLVANLPYNVATPILLAGIEDPEAIARSLVMVQREVALRLRARPGDPSYGFLSVRTGAFAGVRLLFDLPPEAFRPRPRVTSSVVELKSRLAAPESLVRNALGLASLGFRWRRKTLANALAGEGGRARWEKALEAMGKSPMARAEELSLEDYLRLAELRR
jgi:16S rRNA (adenine1518-N6/adenine1519-N6)-dimethyltransferase